MTPTPPAVEASASRKRLCFAADGMAASTKPRRVVHVSAQVPSQLLPVPSPREPSRRLRFAVPDQCLPVLTTSQPSSRDAPERVGVSRRGAPAEVLRTRLSVANSRRRTARQFEQADAIQCLPGRTRVETLRVGPASRRQCLHVLWLLVSWSIGLSKQALLGCSSLLLWSAVVHLKNLEKDDEILDDMMAGWVDACHWEGGHSSWGGRLHSALAWLLPRFQRQGAGHLPRLSQARLSAAKRSPGQTRLPYPEPVIFALIMTVASLLQSRHMSLDPAIMLLVAHHCYLRPGELLRIRWKFPTSSLEPKLKRIAVTLHPTEASKSSKTGEYDETVIIDSPALVRILEPLILVRDPDAFLVPVKPKVLSDLFDEAIKVLKIDVLLGRETLYVLRHSGASADAWSERRTLLAIQARGRWKAVTSMRRYQKGGRVAERLNKCGAPLVQYALRCVTTLEAVLRGQSKPSLLR